ncbi:MAG: type II toxin-antitoxin system VapC family toxin [Alphaproteobacteria bacterium]|nr:type II toxin-antitoxin system VapC family toxin [Alphaproteobacteria bacterium]MBV9370299.1 type II toxin-antitoxin system VapC family toxin [Alphaproteobacteria bacterium]MBV9901171.1 type II toxin-antitoxin system VapC family toxin [Alphaproteobacteria bacterium]
MIAVDTNIVVRLLVNDDSEQRAKALSLVEGGIFVSRSVLMETEWVLRSAYRLARQAVNDALADLLALDGVHAGDAEMLDWALDRHRAGADWADMLHLIDARPYPAFATFDRGLSRAAGDKAPVVIEVPV